MRLIELKKRRFTGEISGLCKRSYEILSEHYQVELKGNSIYIPEKDIIVECGSEYEELEENGLYIYRITNEQELRSILVQLSKNGKYIINKRIVGKKG